ncbi:MAG: hypothetical protein MRJ96_07555 [Nitrospirales bacterium]|nr:hypothetical protein [Nitrospira sp.]MDR4501288.1 hypothetical protein [Nitrospirales bacterium]
MKNEESDNAIAEEIKTLLKNSSDVETVIVKGHLLRLHITQSLYNRFANDRERGRKIVLMLMQSMKRLTGSSDVTVWIYTDQEKVIEGRVKEWGGDNVQYFYDL